MILRRRLFGEGEDQYLTFTAVNDTMFLFDGPLDPYGAPQDYHLYYSLNNGSTWTLLPDYTYTPTVTAGNKIMWKCSDVSPQTDRGIGTFYATQSFTVEGNPMSLLFGDNFKGKKSLVGKDFALYRLFDGNSFLTDASNLNLPATTLSEQCYQYMFRNCDNLVHAPKLPSRNLAIQCYCRMFEGCKVLVEAPELPATTLANGCYAAMFEGCLTITSAPVLPATTLVSGCYNFMFNECANLIYVKAMFTTTPGINYTHEWLKNVGDAGTFVKNSAATWNVQGVDGIPSNWTVQTASS